MPRLLVVHHTPSPTLQAVLEAVREGAALVEEVELVLRPALSAGAADILAAARSVLRVLVDPRDYRRAMTDVRVPVLLVHGNRDRLVPVENARSIARRNPDWRYLELTGVGHVPQLQVPDRLATEVLAWLAELPAVPLPG